MFGCRLFQACERRDESSSRVVDRPSPSVLPLICGETATSLATTQSHSPLISSSDLSHGSEQLVLLREGATLLAQLDLRNNDDSVRTGD